jgi:hypothetical protein
MVSGLSGSPLLNGMLPALGIIPLFLRLKQNRNGYFFQITSACLLIGLTWLPIESGPSKSIVLVGTFTALFLHGTGKALSSRPLMKDLLDRPGSSSGQLRVGQDVGFFYRQFNNSDAVSCNPSIFARFSALTANYKLSV